MEERSHIKYWLIKLTIFVALAIVVGILADKLVEHLKPFIGSLMVLYGLEEILFECIYDRKHLLHRSKVYLGLVEVTLGLFTLIANVEYASVCVIWATWSIMRESYEIKEILGEIKSWIPRIISGVESIVVIVFSLMLILEPGHHHALTHMYLLIAELILAPAIPLIDELIAKKKNSK